ncbi:MAG TPA: glycoside hydrolase family 13 protein [Bacillota bacterium]|nr:glycoside hydrolase family 13 protein [Bacillota bacterium]HOL09096.1 glycoside hydrolase family 13 protein [Bacillota bacterium]HPO98026.1 glycoside hydrolase family 13 protein [Bacillota bacterium]
MVNQMGFMHDLQQNPKLALPPDWASKSIFYQIFPDRFYNGNPDNDPVGKVDWDAQPTYDNFFGGDLEGIIEKIPYLKELGVTALYLNPIFDSPSNHKYNATDYLKIAPEFGDIWTFKKLIGKLHEVGMKIIIDGVFNHTGDTFWAFQDILKRGCNSRFKDWYYIKGYPVCQGQNPNYECWWNFGTLPKLNHQNPEVIRYLLRVVAFWTSIGIDGWRLDVPNEVPMEFWRIFRRLVRSINPEAFIVGEIWDDAHTWLKGDSCDAVMNYRWRDAVIKYFAHQSISVEHFRAELANIRAGLPWEYVISAYNLLGSHDTPRYLTICGGERRKLLATLAFQFTYPGIPAMYYGDEIGLTGDKDPDCRKTMRWNEAQQDQVILETNRSLAKLRQQYQSLQTGCYHELHLGDNIFGFVRSGKQEQILVCINMSHECYSIKVPNEWEHGWEPVFAVGTSLSSLAYPELPPMGVRIFKRGSS